jgi:2-polyprenyl-6-methoxyphenol hydroxylase-like FAD-dependent oxidoreductase
MTGQGRTAEIAGAGLSGLFLAAALAQRGWRVTLHERAAEMRMFGAGIWLWENGLTALESVGAYEQTVRRAQHMSSWDIIDHRVSIIRRRKFRPGDRLMVPLREDLYNALIDVATRAGVQIVTSSLVRGAEPEGSLVMADGSKHTADLVVGADGLRSSVRESLHLTKHFRNLGNGAIRMLIPREAGEDAHISAEHWSGNRVLLYNPCSPQHVYLCLVCPTTDTAGKQVPLDRETWTESFPALRSVIARIGTEGRWDDFETVEATRWSEGRVAIVGDAAHGQPPWLGQAANLAFANTLALAVFVTYYSDVPMGLRAWEQHLRPVTDHTERWTNLYGRLVNFWPPRMQGVRSVTLRTFVSLPFVENMLNVAPHTPVTRDAASRGSAAPARPQPENGAGAWVARSIEVPAAARAVPAAPAERRT